MKKNYNYKSDIENKLNEIPSFENCETLELKLCVAELTREYWKQCGHELSSAHWDGVVKGIKAAMELDKWIPVSEGFPEDVKIVLVTYLGYLNGIPHCDDTAYRLDGKWYWQLDDSVPIVEIVAWKPLGEPYRG